METTDQSVQEQEPAVMLTPEEKNDLRRRVLLGYQMSLKEARAVIESSRNGAAIAVLAGETKKRGGKKKPALSDEALDADMDALLNI